MWPCSKERCSHAADLVVCHDRTAILERKPSQPPFWLHYCKSLPQLRNGCGSGEEVAPSAGSEAAPPFESLRCGRRQESVGAHKQGEGCAYWPSMEWLTDGWRVLGFEGGSGVSAKPGSENALLSHTCHSMTVRGSQAATWVTHIRINSPKSREPFLSTSYVFMAAATSAST